MSRSGRLKTRQRIKKIVQITTNHRINNGLLWLNNGLFIYAFREHDLQAIISAFDELQFESTRLRLHAVNASGLFQII